MNILDESIPIPQRQRLQGWHIPVRHLGFDLGQEGIKDIQVIPFLHSLLRPTFFTLDSDFFNRALCHARYCLVYLDVEQHEAAVFIRRFIRRSDFNTVAKRLGKVVRVSRAGIRVWKLHAEHEAFLNWSD